MERIIPLIRITCDVKDQENISFFMCAPRMMVLNLTNKFNENENHFPRIFCENLKIVA